MDRSAARQRYGRRNVIGRGIDDHVAALQRCRQTFRLRGVERKRGDAELGKHPKTRFALIENQNVVVTGLAKKVSDGVADLARADQCYTTLVAVLVGHDHALRSRAYTFRALPSKIFVLSASLSQSIESM
jgi:hypothetical protein